MLCLSFGDVRATGLTRPDRLSVVSRAAASAPDLDRSDALEALPTRGYDRWTRAALDAFHRSPEELVLGTTTFVGMPDPKERADMIADLAQAPRGPGE